jgi:hypothetical protein
MHHSYKRRPDGKYSINGRVTRFDLVMNKHGRVVSVKKHNTAKREKRLLKHGYTAKKGKFGAVKIGARKSRKARN